ILGQVLDLSGHNNKLEQILKLHELKTARLIQLALTGSALLCHKKELTSDMLELGKAIGINFQLLDDLCELTEAVNQHEKEINPFIHFPPEKIIEIIKINSVSIRTICKHHQLKELQNYINLYYAKIKETLEVHQVQINKYFKFSKDDLEGLFN
ncbi:MAG: hypothetical protein HON90_07855, partial [Halobacteriovoraceae bacterium]|nr:hypothetical protein [Halobacteriovoraceae bacterium]